MNSIRDMYSFVHCMNRFVLIMSVVGIFFLLSLVLSACSVVETAPVDPISTPVVPATETATVTDTPPAPSPTPEPGLVVLYTPEGSDAVLGASLEQILGGLAGVDGLVLKQLTEISDGDWGAGIRLVVALPPDPGVAAIAAAHPDTQFLAIGFQDLEPAPNLSLLGTQAGRPDQQGFVAGYLAAVITQDWRVGVISRPDTNAGKAAEGGFTNGAIFYCGLCRPAYPPFFQYPVVTTVAAGASQVDMQAAADTLVSNTVQTVYVAPGAGDDSLLEHLSGLGLNIIGSRPPPAQAQVNWVASIQVDWVADPARGLAAVDQWGRGNGVGR